MKILFQGDSITDCCRNRDDEQCLGDGYANKVSEVSAILYPDKDLIFVNKGVSGDRVRDLLIRYEKDILQVKPDVISILVGVNDTWRRYDDNDITSVERFEEEYTKLLSQIRVDLQERKLSL